MGTPTGTRDVDAAGEPGRLAPRPSARNDGTARMTDDVQPLHRKEEDMAAHAGEKAQKTGDFYCASCDAKVHVKEGDTIPECPNGHKSFEARRNEPGNKS